MANKLIATEFDYTWQGQRDGEIRTFRGSYLGRTRATARTLRAFVNRGIASTGADMRLLSLRIGGSYVSQWIAK